MEALYLKIRDELARQIKNRVYREGETLPSEDELAERFGVSRPTIRRAIQELVDDGMLEKKPYRGTTVCPAKIEQGFTTMLRSFNEEILANGRIPRTTVLTARVQEASPEVSSRMGVEVGAPLFKLVRLRYAGDYPNVLVSSLIPLDMYPGIVEVDFSQESLYAYFRKYGKPVVRAHRQLEVVKASPGMAALLDIDEGDPVYRFYTTATTEAGRVAEYTTATYRGRSNAFEFDVSLVDGSQVNG